MSDSQTNCPFESVLFNDLVESILSRSTTGNLEKQQQQTNNTEFDTKMISFFKDVGTDNANQGLR